MAHPKRITASEWQQWPLRHQLSKRANVLGTREAKSGKSVATFARILRNTWGRGALPRNGSNGPFVISFPKERMYWALVKRNQAKAWPLLLGYFGILGGAALFIGSIFLMNKAH